MTSSAIFLILFSTLLHAAWNMYSRKFRATSSSFAIGGFAVSTLLLPFYLYFIALMPDIRYENILLIVLSSLFQACYFFGVVNAYKYGNLSLSYPLLRSIPILMVLIYVWVFGNIKTVSNIAIISSLLIVLGCILLPMRHLKDLKLENYANKMFVFVLIAALGTAGYSIVDSLGVKLLAANSPHVHITMVAFNYIYLQLLFTSFFLTVISMSKKSYRTEFVTVIKQQKLLCTGISVMTMLSYAPILVAMTLVTNVSYVVAFRQASIPIAFLLGVFILKEMNYSIRWLAVLLIVIGLVMNAIY
ncbi:MAG: hypothetical protein HRU06_09920 [Oceanospirillaceae bacterium]|nr:hypothetical protein [Oceanospirillaceae bacterium]